METETLNNYNHWAYFPLHLSPEEIERPLSVVAAFFDDDRLPGQLAMLKAWREFVLKPDYYRGPKNSPSTLLYFYKINIALIEAMYLLHQSGTTDKLNLSSDELAKEKNSWTVYPVFLSTSELHDPFLFLQSFFAAYSLPQYREQLADWLEHGLSCRPAAEFIGTVELITVYENLQKLHETAWVIHQRTSDRPYLILQKEKEHNIALEIKIHKQETKLQADVTLYSLNTDTSLPSAGLLSLVVGLIKHKVPSVQAVIYLGTPPDAQSPLFLLVLTDSKEREQANTLSATIEQSCRELASVIALVHHASSLFTALEHHNLFFGKALTCPVIHLSGELLLPASKPLHTNFSSSGNLVVLWERWQRQGIDFLEGAAYHLEKGAANAALFCLQQCAECLLIAIIRAVTGYRINNHNLSKLLNLTKMFTDDLAEVFPLENNQYAEHFNLLKQAYVNVRYKDDFQAEPVLVQALYPLVKHFVTVAGQVYQTKSVPVRGLGSEIGDHCRAASICVRRARKIRSPDGGRGDGHRGHAGDAAFGVRGDDRHQCGGSHGGGGADTR